MNFTRGTPRDERWPGRRARIIQLVDELWAIYPDQRLGQLILNYLDRDAGKLFSLEDDEVERRLSAAVQGVARE